MRKALYLFLGLFMAMCIAIPAWAQNSDAMAWMKGDYVGVGGINVEKFSKTPLFGELMKFFTTNKEVKQAFQIIFDAGLVPEKVVNRVVVGIPNDVEKSEHIIFWETKENLDKYKELLISHTDVFDIRKHQGIEYFATKRENECLAIIDNVLVLGSELRVKEILEAVSTKYKKGIQRAALQTEIKRTNKSKDAWFAFALTAKEQERTGSMDPVVDMTASGLGMLKLGELKSGNLSFDFSKGLKVSAFLKMVSEASAAQTSNLLMTLLQNGTTDEEVKSLGIESFLNGITFSSQKQDIRMNIDYDQAKFNQLIEFVTQFAKSVSTAH